MPFYFAFCPKSVNNFTKKRGATDWKRELKGKIMNATQFEAKGEQLQNGNATEY